MKKNWIVWGLLAVAAWWFFLRKKADTPLEIRKINPQGQGYDPNV